MSFDPALPTDRDWMRLLTGDTDTANEQLADTTLDALLVEAVAHGASAAGAKYCAAAQAGELMAARWQVTAGPIAEKTVSKLRLVYQGGSQSSAIESYRAYLTTLKDKCTQLSLQSPSLLKAW